MGFAIGLFLNETVLMIPELILAYPLTTPFKKLVKLVPAVDDNLHRISDWGLESLRNELDRRNGIIEKSLRWYRACVEIAKNKPVRGAASDGSAW